MPKISSKKRVSTCSYPSLHEQRGASVTGIVFFVLALGVFIKLAIAIIPAQIGDYQLTKVIANELKRANSNNETAKIFINDLEKQLSINADYTTKPEEMLSFTNNKVGSLAVHKKYEVVNKFVGNVYIVNRFEDDITSSDASE